MNLTLRSGKESDARPCGEICWKAFSTISKKHNYPPDFPSTEVAAEVIGAILKRPEVYSVVAEVDGTIVGSNFLWEGDTIAGIGPITVDPGTQNGGVGRQLMENVLERTVRQGFAGVRLVQAAYHSRSLSLYAKLGFVVREPLATMQGTPLRATMPGHT
ncbi:MAG TPA: GNAT family N-acetyltransferase, partial [Verrucomicrobiales bacterium]|nr:GNAT family N-acetyltransferase [Verrucomicrobiales bacterium]